MKVLMTADTVGGVWTYALELAAALRTHDVEVVLATMAARPSREQRKATGALGNVTLVDGAFRVEWMDDPWDDVDRASDWLLELAASVRPDVIHLNDLTRGGLPWPAPVLVAAHSCVCSWWRAVYGEPAPERYAVYRRRVGTSLRAADLVVTPTVALGAALRREYGAELSTRVVPNARDPRRFRTGRKRDIVFSAGRVWDEAKNHAALDRAAAAVSWPVFVAGPVRHPSGRELELEHARALGLLTPHELACWLGDAALFALPARYEPFGLGPLEAALSGCALVLGDIPSLREVWDDTASYVPPGDHLALARAIERLSANADERLTFAQRARARALMYAPAAQAQAYHAMYAGLVRAGRAGREGATQCT